MLVDSHCHLNHINLTEFGDDLDNVLQLASEAGVEHLLSVCVVLNDFPRLTEIAQRYPQVSISVGLHPAEEAPVEPTCDELVHLAQHERCIAIGETGLDYFHVTQDAMRAQQRQRFSQHIQAALHTQKPLIIHTRDAAEDTMAILRSEQASQIGGVMHCFTESWEVAKQALDLNFYISFSGIVTFKNAHQLREVAQKVPLDRILIETDAPYLAPVPYRGKQNHPALVKYVAVAISELRQMSMEEVAEQTRQNFYQCFRLSHPVG